MTEKSFNKRNLEEEMASSPLAHRPLAARKHWGETELYVMGERKRLKTPVFPSFSKIFNELGKVFRKSDEAQIEEDLTFLLKWGLKYGSKLSSFKASQAENALMKTLIGAYELRESSRDREYLTIPKLMIEFAGSTMKLAKDMPDTVSGVGEDKRLETPAYAWAIYLLRLNEMELAKRHEEAHLYARYMFSEAINRRNESWQSKSISLKVREVKRYYEIASGQRITPLCASFHVSNKEKKLLVEAAGGKNLIPSSIINEASAKWQELIANSTEAY